MKLYAIKRPDGTVIQAEPSYGESHAWFNAYVFECPSPLNNIEHSKNLGYRCVEVQLVEKDAVCEWAEDGGRVLKTSCGRYWQTLEDGDRIDFPYCPYCGRKIVDSTAPTGGAESKEEGK